MKDEVILHLSPNRQRTIGKQRIHKIFREAKDQHEALIALYRWLYPDWDQIDHLDGWPTCGEELGDYLQMSFIRFDKAHHPDVISGGLWMNRGWGVDLTLESWEVVPAPAVYKEV